LRILILFLLSINVFSLFTCTVIEPEPEYKLDPVESKIIFSVTYDSTQVLYDHTGYLLLLKTEKIYGCSNYKIRFKMNTSSDKIIVEMLGIDRGEMCATAYGPAMTLIPLDISDGIYLIELIYEGVTDKYSLKVVEKSVKVDFVNSDFTIYQLYNSFFN
jgi:hypothetical protein